jgi:phenylpropionate dioxygenase-like ring-hydroxylating dioxygenase large terminal subunit
VLEGRDGHCSGLIRCPYHAWCYAWDGRLRAVAAAKTFPEIDTSGLGLVPLDSEVFAGLVFLRFQGGGPSVAERYAPYAAELAAHRIEEMVPIADYWIGEIDADWKNVWDNYLEDYHFPTGHPGLFGLMSGTYDREPDDETRTIRLSHALRRDPDGGWSTRAYGRLLPDVPHLPEALKRRWTYLFLYPAVSLELYPDMLDYFHILPAGPGRSILRWRAYARPDDRRAMQVTRRLNLRVNNRVHDEDAALIRSVQQGLAGSAYGTGVLGEKEINLRTFQGWIRKTMPEAG